MPAKTSKRGPGTTRRLTCYMCGGEIQELPSRSGNLTEGRCMRCAAFVTISTPSGTETFQVQGVDASEVQQVSSHLVDQAHARKVSARSRNPWVSGSFYLVVLLSVVVLFLVAGKQLNIVAFPIVLIGGILAVSIVGALQLRQDERLTEKNFLSLMLLAFRQLPLLNSAGKEAEDKSKTGAA